MTYRDKGILMGIVLLSIQFLLIFSFLCGATIGLSPQSVAPPLSTAHPTPSSQFSSEGIPEGPLLVLWQQGTSERRKNTLPGQNVIMPQWSQFRETSFGSCQSRRQSQLS